MHVADKIVDDIMEAKSLSELLAAVIDNDLIWVKSERERKRYASILKRLDRSWNLTREK